MSASATRADPRAPALVQADDLVGASQRRFEEVLLLAALAVNVVVALAVRHFPYQDAPNHLARYTLMSRFWSGEAPPNVSIRLLPGPYIAVDLLGAALVRMFGPDAAQRSLVVIALVLPALGLYLLIRAVAPERRGWALAGVFFGFSWFVLAGLLNFVIGVGLALCWLAAWWPRRATARWWERLALAVGGGLLFFVHLAAPLIALVVVWTDYGLALVLALWRSARLRPVVHSGQLAGAIAMTLGVGAAWGATNAIVGGAQVVEGAPVFRSVTTKLLALGSPFYSFDVRQAAIMAVCFAALFAAFVVANRRQLRLDTFTASALVCLLLYAAFPVEIGGAAGADIRWLIPIYLLPFCLTTQGRPIGPQRAALGVAFAACLASAGTVWFYARGLDARLDEYDRALARIPAHTRLLPLLADERQDSRVGPYRQYALWHIIRKRGQVPGLWSLTGPGEGEAPIPYLQHFATVRHGYYPRDLWADTDPPTLDWARIRADYDYLIAVIDSPRVQAYMAAHAQETFRSASVIVYRTAPSPGAPPPPNGTP